LPGQPVPGQNSSRDPRVELPGAHRLLCLDDGLGPSVSRKAFDYSLLPDTRGDPRFDPTARHPDLRPASGFTDPPSLCGLPGFHSMSLAILLGTFAILFFLVMPVAFAMIVASWVYILYSGFDLSFMALQMFAGLDFFVLLAIPLFIL